MFILLTEMVMEILTAERLCLGHCAEWFDGVEWMTGGLSICDVTYSVEVMGKRDPLKATSLNTMHNTHKHKRTAQTHTQADTQAVD